MAASADIQNPAMRGAKVALVTLTAINLVNYLDRYLIAGMIGPIKNQFGATDSQVGLLTSVFLLFYLLTSPIFGLLARRVSRTMLLAVGVLLWSLATVASGLATSLLLLFCARAIVGVGEAAYSTVGPALLADHFAPSRRAAALSIFFAAIPVGTALSYIVAGAVEQAWGWNWVFLAGGVPGMALALICLRLDDPAPGRTDDPEQPVHNDRSLRTMRASIATICKSRQFAIATAGYIAFTFAFGALAVWMPYYLESARGWSRTSATSAFGATILGCGLVGTVGGGWVAKKLGGGPRACMYLCAACMAVALPSTLLALYATTDWVILAGLIVASTFSFATQGPVNAVILNAVSAPLRPLAIGISVMLIHLLGDVPSPWLVGQVSESSLGMGWALSVIPTAMGVAAIAWFIGGRTR